VVENVCATLRRQNVSKLTAGMLILKER